MKCGCILAACVTFLCVKCVDIVSPTTDVGEAAPCAKTWDQFCMCEVNLGIRILCFPSVVDRRGESEESGDDETRRRSINGDVDPRQPASTGESSPADIVSAVIEAPGQNYSTE